MQRLHITQSCNHTHNMNHHNTIWHALLARLKLSILMQVYPIYFIFQIKLRCKFDSFPSLPILPLPLLMFILQCAGKKMRGATRLNMKGMLYVPTSPFVPFDLSFFIFNYLFRCLFCFLFQLFHIYYLFLLFISIIYFDYLFRLFISIIYFEYLFWLFISLFVLILIRYLFII